MEVAKLKMVLLLFAFIWLVSASDSHLSPKGVNYEVAALMSMKSRIRDERRVMEGWDINSVDPCTWFMVACSTEGFVVSLFLGKNDPKEGCTTFVFLTRR
ncbi:probable LRR receptor-like serine/threonine-protein kinase At5g45780 [Cucurbita moschata]|uniref:Probable LRR receptor-like serine/threonine-protein kinase At5g45780 n=1 Tax=Cucurbita moschata TaxID=3662 RepID=A0A6J1EFS3_CUCMO|nr:probable LRR receptor-like serine/threonine-protein kinase At5g45780 [Cucurbita moschata]